jgi:REP element-mobilizing transposase RayT
MARPIRLEFAGALYHVTSRGNRQEVIYEHDDDRRAFLSILEDVCRNQNWICYAYCLMSNHYHLLIETPDANLSKGMRQLNGVYTQTHNRVHQRVGHVFQGRYKAILVQKETYLLELSRYIVLNPVRARMVRSTKDWPWSSYRATAAQSTGPECLNTERVLAAFSRRKGAAIEKYKKFVAEGRGQAAPWKALKNQMYLGDDEFIEDVQALIDSDRDLSEVPSSQRRPVPRRLAEYVETCHDRNTAIVTAYRSGAYTLKQIGDYFGLHYSTVSGIIKANKTMV